MALEVSPDHASPIMLVSAHAPPPQGDLTLTARMQYFQEITRYLSSLPPSQAMVLAGDFNTTPLLDAYQWLVQSNGLENAAYGRGLPITWPLPKLPLFGAYIDQVMYRNIPGGSAFNVFPSFGSDHLPVAVSFELPGALR